MNRKKIWERIKEGYNMNLVYLFGVIAFISFFIGWFARGILDRKDTSEDYGV